MINSSGPLILSFSLTYYLIERNGLFSGAPVPVTGVLYSIPLLSASILFLIVTLVAIFRNLQNVKISDCAYVMTVLLLISGLWMSYLTRFSGEVVLTEGQTFYSGHRDYMPETLYRGRFARVPDIGLKLEELIATFSKDRKDFKELNGKFSLISSKEDRQREIMITTGLPTLIGNSFFRIKDMGYSPRYALKSKEGRVLDSSFIFMKLFPPGSEDNFRLLSPLTYYVRYNPDGTGDLFEPSIELRIVRNKDIVFNGKIKLSEDAAFENNRISFEEVRKWTRLSIKRDWGEILALGGLLLGFVNVTAGFIARRT